MSGWKLISRSYNGVKTESPSYNGVKTELEPCDDYISREETLEALMDEWTDFDSELMDYLIEKVRKLPSVTPQPKMGQWERDKFTNQPTCSVCGYKVFGGQTNYCPACGAKMSEIPTGSEGSDKE